MTEELALEHLDALGEPDPRPGRGRMQLAAVLVSLAVLLAVAGLVARGFDDRSTIHELQRQSACRSALSTGVDVAVSDALLAILDRDPAQPIDRDKIDAIAGELRAARESRALTSTLC